MFLNNINFDGTIKVMPKTKGDRALTVSPANISNSTA